MSWTWSEQINLAVAGRIDPTDADRQTHTARDILRRFTAQPGVVLADEVGMGKTFVALAVAVSVALSDKERRPVVVMMPPSLRTKWPKDFALFKERCLPPDIGSQLRHGVAERPVEFLKLLDDPHHLRKHILFVTHGAMSRAPFDRWVKLALIGQAVKGRWGAADMRERLSWQLGDLLQMKNLGGMTEELYVKLLNVPPSEWLELLQRHGVDPTGNGNPHDADDPVPYAIIETLDKVNLDALYTELDKLPKNWSKGYYDRIRNLRIAMQGCLQQIWQDTVHALRLQLPLLVLDEAHHLKNAQTRLASLFQVPESRDDVEQVTRGALGDVFERMLFLTATPFQLGHSELCSVLDRFDGIAWKSPSRPETTRDTYRERRNNLRLALDGAQVAAMRLDSLWGKLTHEDLIIGDVRYHDPETWWQDVRGPNGLSTAAAAVYESWVATQTKMDAANTLLRPWVIRHLRPRTMRAGPKTLIDRRKRLAGRAIDGKASDDETGLRVDGDALLPFLLAARATIAEPDARPLFAEGLASCYEAFLHTRRPEKDDAPAGLDVDDAADPLLATAAATEWYLQNLEEVVDAGLANGGLPHPKLDATIRRALALWEQGEKVLVFCHYVVTGRVLRERISRAIARRITELACERLSCNAEDASDQLDRIGTRFFDVDSPLRQACDATIATLVAGYPQLTTDADKIVDVVRRFVRTPSFLVRFLLRADRELDPAEFDRAIRERNASGMSLYDLIERFLQFIADRSMDERAPYVEALDSVQTGSHQARDTSAGLTDDELQGASPGELLPNVRLVNGTSRPETRQRLMLTFNTPFYPEVLIASSVMAEGVDLHLNCRHIIHHDLCWNPSTLEQRTGRVDRIGAKCEQTLRPVEVYLPYIAETQDEKMYRVVMDRERWFSVVMGEQFKPTTRSAESIASRLPFPSVAAASLAFRLEVS